MVRIIRIKINARKSDELFEKDLGILFLNLAILSLLLPVFLEVLSLDIKKSNNYRSIDSIKSQVIQGTSHDNLSSGTTFIRSPRHSMDR